MTNSTVPLSALTAMLGAAPPRDRTRWLAHRIITLIGEGRIPTGARLPAERALAASTGLSRGTVVAALEVAVERGFLISRQGSGRVARLPVHSTRPVESLDARMTPAAAGTVDLRATVLPPHPGLHGALQRAVDEVGEDPSWGSAPADGLPELITAICEYYERRGLVTHPSQVIVTAGAVSGLHLALRAVTSARDRVATENPGYPNTARVIRAAGRRVLPIDITGGHSAAILSVLRMGGLAAAMLTPDFHNPSGTFVGEAERARLLRAAAANEVSLVIDETLVGMNWREAPVATPLTGLGARTVLVGSASKSIWAGLRIGWIRAPEALADRIARVRLGIDLGAPVLEQRVAAALLPTLHADGVPAHADRIRASAESAERTLVSALPHWQWTPPDGGLSLWCTGLRTPAEQLVRRAADRGIALRPGALFSPTGTGWPHALRIPLTARPDELQFALETLADLDH